MANYIQKSYVPAFGNKNIMTTNIVEDISFLVNEANSGDGNQQVLGTSVWANKFTPVGSIDEDITLPTPGSFTYPTPLQMSAGKILTVPVVTTLTIV
jgi:hypothetical protein